MMNQNQPNFFPLYLILIGTLLLMLPALYGTLFLFIFAAAAITDPHNLQEKTNLLALLYPLPAIIGFLLLGGYIWTMAKKRFVKWFWLISASFNLLITLASGGFLFKMSYESFNTLSTNDLPKLIFLLFPLWTLFVTIASVKYAFYKPKSENFNLP